MVSLGQNPPWPGPWGGCWSISTHRVAASWGQDATLLCPLSISHWVWPPALTSWVRELFTWPRATSPAVGASASPGQPTLRAAGGASPAQQTDGGGRGHHRGMFRSTQHTANLREIQLIALPAQRAHHTQTHTAHSGFHGVEI